MVDEDSREKVGLRSYSEIALGKGEIPLAGFVAILFGVRYYVDSYSSTTMSPRRRWDFFGRTF